MERPRTRFVEIAVPYLTAKARIAPLNVGSQDLVLDTIYRTHYSTSNDLNVARPAPTVPCDTQFVSSFYQDGVQVAKHQPVLVFPDQRFVDSKYVAKLRNANSQQLPRLDSSLQATQNEAQSHRQRKRRRQALPEAPHPQLDDNGTLAHQQQVTQYASPLQAPNLQPAQTSHQSQNLGQPQQSRADPTPNNWTQSSFYQQPPCNASLRQLYNSSGPSITRSSQFRITPVDASGMPVSSIRHQDLDTPNPQPQGYSTRNEFGIFSNSSQSNIVPAEDTSIVTGSMGQQNMDVSQPQHEEDSLDDVLDLSQSMPSEDHYNSYNSGSLR
ncbi:hypothetical protein FDENT_8858 [Fusarium denticulatum]|uniref:Uncharacterized protein n=1 Tax=Fusarium denticulatum TaxID=48507 RepID=A0A8H5TY27_9HYPO|nr:hypothetical protein FDENT_8858 [Fusarium denticulatum]